MHLPNYKDGSIVNLMQSIIQARGGKASTIYRPLKVLPPKQLRDSNNIVLLVIDGLGYEWLNKHGKNTFLYKNLTAKITSVCPTTTTSCVTTFFTGVAPKQHAMTGFIMHSKELGSLYYPLFHRPRYKGEEIKHISSEHFFDQKPASKQIRAESYFVGPAPIVKSVYSVGVDRYSIRAPASSLAEIFRIIPKICKSSNKHKYIYAYLPEFDLYCHHNKTTGKKPREFVNKIDRKIEALSKQLKDTTLIVTADHGLLDTPRNKYIFLEDHPKLKETLTLPICSEWRMPYFYVRPSRAKQFEQYIKTKLKSQCTYITVDEMIKRNYFGLGKPNPKLFDRVGDYILLMKENWAFKDTVLGGKDKQARANHAGLSKEEMFVPLVVIKT
ncbi:alkaline phosphatase family protein [Candidatus Woesearchaeota archaeon]|nr:alkaline phosphatase family protein [Candidatus Woesearchaeota archaeon]